MSTNSKEYQKKYENEKLRVYRVKLNTTTDADVISQIENVKEAGESIQGYIKRLIRYDIKYGAY